MSTRYEPQARGPAAPASAARGRGRVDDWSQEVALIARARRELMLRVHGHRLRREDLEDCYSQATLELLTRALHGGRFAGLYRSGVRPIAEIVRDNPLAQDYQRWGAPGPGRWVTIYATATPSPHVFVVITGLRLDTSHAGTDIGPNRDEDGPRWRILNHIPTWANWTVRHPPGL